MSEKLSLVPQDEELPLPDKSMKKGGEGSDAIDKLLGEAATYELVPLDTGTSLERPAAIEPFDWTGGNTDLAPKQEDR